MEAEVDVLIASLLNSLVPNVGVDVQESVFVHVLGLEVVPHGTVIHESLFLRHVHVGHVHVLHTFGDSVVNAQFVEGGVESDDGAAELGLELGSSLNSLNIVTRLTLPPSPWSCGHQLQSPRRSSDWARFHTVLSGSFGYIWARWLHLDCLIFLKYE